MQLEVVGGVVDPVTAWAWLGDTDWLNRIAGGGAMRYAIVEGAGGTPELRGSMDGLFGSTPFLETRVEWVHQRWFEQVRRYDSKIFGRSHATLQLEPEGEGVRPVLRLVLEEVSTLGKPLVAVHLARVKAAWSDVVAKLPAPGRPSDAMLGGVELGSAGREAMNRWSAELPAELSGPLGSWLMRARASDLRQIRPFRVADRLGLPRDRTLEALLQAVPAGLLELYWSVRCERCHGELGASASLSDLPDHLNCASCQLGTQTDLGESVEVLFAPHPSLGARVSEKFCTVFPSGAPEIRARVALAPGAVREVELGLPPGAWRLGSGGATEDVRIQVGDAGARALRWAPGVEGQLEVGAGAVRLLLENPSAEPMSVTLSRQGQADDFASASLLTTLPAWRRQLDATVLSPDLRLATRRVALLFTDLSGSTALYERLGDAAAFALVRDHFTLLTDVVSAHQGVVVKTIGDAVMAAFHSEEHAVSAGLAMQAAFVSFRGGRAEPAPVQLKIGVHVGPALVVHAAGGGLDYFGRTVNLAARAQGRAEAGELVLTAEMMASEVVQRVLREAGCVPVRQDADLKGFEGAYALWHLKASC